MLVLPLRQWFSAGLGEVRGQSQLVLGDDRCGREADPSLVHEVKDEGGELIVEKEKAIGKITEMKANSRGVK